MRDIFRVKKYKDVVAILLKRSKIYNIGMNIISMKQLRENFGALKAELEAGESFLLMYRSQPLAELKPVKQKKFAASKTQIKKNLALVKRLAGGIHLGKYAKDVTPDKINELLDQRYEKVLP